MALLNSVVLSHWVICRAIYIRYRNMATYTFSYKIQKPDTHKTHSYLPNASILAHDKDHLINALIVVTQTTRIT